VGSCSVHEYIAGAKWRSGCNNEYVCVYTCTNVQKLERTCMVIKITCRQGYHELTCSPEGPGGPVAPFSPVSP
jgi:hypothetical protein